MIKNPLSFIHFKIMRAAGLSTVAECLTGAKKK